MVGRTSQGLEAKDSCNFFEDLQRELGTSVGKEGVGKTKVLRHVINKILSGGLGVNRFVTRNANYPLSR